MIHFIKTYFLVNSNKNTSKILFSLLFHNLRVTQFKYNYDQELLYRKVYYIEDF